MPENTADNAYLDYDLDRLDLHLRLGGVLGKRLVQVSAANWCDVGPTWKAYLDPSTRTYGRASGHGFYNESVSQA